ncbi:sodium:proton antiporter [Opitutales bacterium ASA1]|uniref:sodium:proton antiporter n=1 Tax=Congregicoccus parvus TaxID=3081749 RepID=UPI002B2D70F6|nr:sodium:proton antiporter [Opitutales bacterium ASA1]
MHYSALLASVPSASVHPALVVPFVVLLLLIAIMPLTGDRGRHFWEHKHPLVAGLLGALVAGWYIWRVEDGVHTVTHTLHEYVSFIALIGSLFVVAGGIHVRVRGRSTPLGNVVFLFVGAVVANVIGTTGASMLMIRPWLRMNAWRVTGFHVVFFIFVVSNVGGALTPIGDPPLFLGFLRGIPFFWLVDKAVLPWLFTLGAILAAFYLFDRWSFHRTPKPLQEQAAEPDAWKFEGWRNVALIGVVIGAVFLPAAWFIRETVMLAAALLSLKVTPKALHAANHFTFAPIKEVAALFIGIFMTMMPALDYLEANGREFGVTKPTHYYFATGSLSAVLDNAPTYLNFLQLAEVSAVPDATVETASATATATDESTASSEHLLEGGSRLDRLLAEAPSTVLAISLGAVFFGAMTYIGNGPNFMVKSIAEAAGVRVPTFFGYLLRFSLPILLPILIVTGWVFLR